MDVLPPSLEQMIQALGRFPGVGRKTAQRYAFHLLKGTREDALALAEAVTRAMEQVRRCEVCGNFSEQERCGVCLDTTRDGQVICVVEEAPDILAFDRSGFRGVYHVLGGLFSPLHGIVDPDQLRIAPLVARVQAGGIEELVLATPPSADGEATALWLARTFQPRGIRITRLGMGIPMGGALEYADDITLRKAMESRRAL